MATYVDQTYCGWPHDELPHQNVSQEVTASQMLDHGSISFGKYAFDSLSWEKRSVFTYNKCQEELEKFKSPGLVAKKKAYFEEYYRRIRAMKALQENQQTELSLDYGVDGSISSQTGEEDETMVPSEDIGGGVATADVVVQPEEATIVASAEKIMECGDALEISVEHSGLEIMRTDSDSSRNNIEGHENEDKCICPNETKHLDMDETVHDSVVQSIEEPKQDNISDREDKGVSIENSNLVTNFGPEVPSGEKPLCPRSSKEGDMEVKPARNNVPRKDLAAVRKLKDSVPVQKPKEPTGHARNVPKLENKTKPNVRRSSQESECLVQKMTVKSRNGNGVGSRMSTADVVSRHNKSSIVAVHKPLREVHSNVTTPRPFSLATDKRAAVPSSDGEGAHKLFSKSSSQRPSAAVKGKDTINVQDLQSLPKRTVISSSLKDGGLETKDSPKRTVTSSSIKGRGLENKRSHEEKKKPITLDKQSTTRKARDANVIGPAKARSHEEKKKPIALENQSTTRKARDANVIGSAKARSFNPPPRDRLNSTGGTYVRLRDGFRNAKREEGRHEARATKLHPLDAKVCTPSSAKLKVDVKLITPPSVKTKTDIKVSTAPVAKLRTEARKGRHEARANKLHPPDAKVCTPSSAKLKVDVKLITPPNVKTRTDIKVSTAPVAKLRTEARKMSYTSPIGRRPRLGEQSVDGKKPRQEKPRWR